MSLYVSPGMSRLYMCRTYLNLCVCVCVCVCGATCVFKAYLLLPNLATQKATLAMQRLSRQARDVCGQPQEGNDTGFDLLIKHVCIRSHKLCRCVSVCVCVSTRLWPSVSCMRECSSCVHGFPPHVCVHMCVNIYLPLWRYLRFSVSCTCEYACYVLSVSSVCVCVCVCVCLC